MLEKLNIQYSDFRSQIMTVEELLYHINRTGINRILSRYRHASNEQRSRLIESIFLSIPQMPFFIDDTREGWIVIEGIERIDAIYSFCSNKLPLTSTYFKTGMYEGKTFSSLSLFEKNKLLNTKVEVYAINHGLSGNERFGIYMCLKSRIDSATASWCRSRIYPEEYALVESLAKRISPRIKTDVIENRICHLLLGIDYQRYLCSDDKHHIDNAINSILEKPDFRERMERHSNDIETTISRNIHYPFIFSKDQFIADSVSYHLRQRYDKLPTPLEIVDRYRQIKGQDRDKKIEFNAESFCRAIDIILKSYI